MKKWLGFGLLLLVAAVICFGIQFRNEAENKLETSRATTSITVTETESSSLILTTTKTFTDSQVIVLLVGESKNLSGPCENEVKPVPIRLTKLEEAQAEIRGRTFIIGEELPISYACGPNKNVTKKLGKLLVIDYQKRKIQIEVYREPK